MEQINYEEKSNELLGMFEKMLIEKLRQVLKDSGIEASERDAKIMLAKIGKKLLLEISSE